MSYNINETFSPAQFSSVAQLCTNLCDPINDSTPGLPVHHQLLEFAQTHVHWVCDAIQPSHPLSSPSPPAFKPEDRPFPESGSFQMYQLFTSCSQSLGVSASTISPSNEHPGLISFRMDWLDLLAVQRTLQSLLQYQSSCLYSSNLTSMQDHCKTIALTRRTFVDKVMSLLFNLLSSLVITFLPRSKHPLISWLQSPSADFGAPQNKVCHCFHCFPIYLPWSDGTGCHDLRFLNVEL